MATMRDDRYVLIRNVLFSVAEMTCWMWIVVKYRSLLD